MKNTENHITWKTVVGKILGIVKMILTPVICVILAFVIWSFSVNESTDAYDRIFTITRLSVNGTGTLAERSNLSVIEQPHVSMEITVSGLRKDVIKLTSEDLSAYIDVGSIRETGIHTMEISVNPIPSIRIVSVTPASVDVRIDEIKTVEVAVRPKLESYSIESSYNFGEITCGTEKVEITGPASVIDRIKFVKASVSLGQISTSMVSTASLTPMTGENNVLEEQYLKYVQISKSDVEVRIPVYTEIDVPLSYTYSKDIAPGMTFSVDLSASRIRLRGDPKLFKNVSSLDVIEINSETFGTYLIRLSDVVRKELPEGVEYVGEEQTVSVTVVRHLPPDTEPEESTAAPEPETDPQDETTEEPTVDTSAATDAIPEWGI